MNDHSKELRLSDISEEQLASVLVHSHLSRLSAWIRCQFNFDEDLANLAAINGILRFLKMCRRKRESGNLGPIHNIQQFLPALKNFTKKAAIDIWRKERGARIPEQLDAVDYIEDTKAARAPYNRLIASGYSAKLPLFFATLAATGEAWAFERLRSIAEQNEYDSLAEVLQFIEDHLCGDPSRSVSRELDWFPGKMGNAKYQAVSRLRRRLRATWKVTKLEVFSPDRAKTLDGPAQRNQRRPSKVSVRLARSRHRLTNTAASVSKL